MDQEQTEQIIKRLELGEPLSKITKDKKLPDQSTVYKYARENKDLHERIMNARQTGVWTLPVSYTHLTLPTIYSV